MKAIEELNIKGKNWKELLTDEPFLRTDIITIQDPRNLKKFNMADFHHVKNNLRIMDEGKMMVFQCQLLSYHVIVSIFYNIFNYLELERALHDPNARLKSTAPETRDAIDELNREFQPKKVENAGPAKKEGNAVSCAL